MCGIAGTYNLPLIDDVLPKMLESIQHRGPDAEGKYAHIAGGMPVRLGHRRLSIIDLSTAANQPLVKDGLAVVFNGEIYNYSELAKELSSQGVRFNTSSDTEVLLEAWRRWGPGCLNRLRGMFAFAILDERTGQLFLARDPFGIKPLFVCKRDDGLIFASELKAIARACDHDLQVNDAALVASLMYYWIPESQCVYRGVEKLPPGHWAQIAPGQPYRQHCYYDPQQELALPSDHEPDVHSLRETIRESVVAHMVADVPVYTFLSGGLDSSLLTVIAKQLNPELEAYTIRFREEDKRLEAMPDDPHFARLIARQHDIRLHEIEIAPDAVEMLQRMVEVLDEPIGDAAAINTFLICQAARDAGVKVLLSGMGADELFGGYRKHYACLLAARYRRLPLALRRRMIEPIVARLPVAGRNQGYRWVRWAKRFLNFANLEEEAAFRRSYTHYDRVDFQQLLHPDLWTAVDDLVEEHAEIYWQGPPDDQVNRMCYTDVRMFMTGLNIAYTDRASMAASTEVRVPYIDRHVAKAAFAIPGRRKIRGRERKLPLKKAAEKWLPHSVIYRPKGLFSAPLRAWIRRDLQEMVNDLLVDGEMVRSGMLKGDYLSRMIDEDRRGVADKAKEIWQLLTLETWLRSQRQTPVTC